MYNFDMETFDFIKKCILEMEWLSLDISFPKNIPYNRLDNNEKGVFFYDEML